MGVFDLGPMPLADAFVPPERFAEEEPRHPLELAVCETCGLAQLTEAPPPEALFGEGYVYETGWSDTLCARLRTHAEQLIESHRLGSEDTVVEIASNDGTGLAPFAECGMQVLGVDPAPAPAARARQRGIETRRDFFGTRTSAELRGEGIRADVLLARNVLAHVPEPGDLLRGVAGLLTEDGVAIFEFPYLRDLVEGCQFDTIYHEHRCYFSLTTLGPLIEKSGLILRCVERIPVHGGSLRVTCALSGAPDETVSDLLLEENALRIATPEYLRGLAARAERARGELRARIAKLKGEGLRLAAYGAAAKGTILLNYTGIDAECCDFVVDRNPHKQGRRMPGVGIPILGPEALLERRPDVVLLLAWNFADEILAQQTAFVAAGGRFLVPLPEPRLLPGEPGR